MVPVPIPLIMTRPESSGTAFVDALPSEMRARLQVIQNPLIGIVSLDMIPQIGADDAVIFTSANGVRFAPNGALRVAYCVGQATTDVAAQNGWQSRCLGATADALVGELSALRPGNRLLHLSGVHARGGIARRLGEVGINVVREVLYDQKALPLGHEARKALAGTGPVIVPLFSPRTAAQFARECPKDASPCLLALSDAVAVPLVGLRRASVDIAAVPSADAMQAGLEKLLSRVSLG